MKRKRKSNSIEAVFLFQRRSPFFCLVFFFFMFSCWRNGRNQRAASHRPFLSSTCDIHETKKAVQREPNRLQHLGNNLKKTEKTRRNRSRCLGVGENFGVDLILVRALIQRLVNIIRSTSSRAAAAAAAVLI